MRFQELHFGNDVVKMKIDNAMALCKKIHENGPQRMDAAMLRDLLGQGNTGKILRQLFVKTHHGVSRGDNPQPAEWAINRRAYADLVACHKFFLGGKDDLKEIFFEEEKVKHQSKTETEARYRAVAEGDTNPHAILEH